MPQMSPMNWLMLFLFFNGAGYFMLCKLNSMPSIMVSGSGQKTMSQFKILII